MRNYYFIICVLITGLFFAIDPAFADQTASVNIASGSSVPGCETTRSCYIPYEVTVDVGGEVTWNNVDSAAHTVTSGNGINGPDGLFDSSLFMAGATFSVRFDDYALGEYDYFCMVHPWMEGVIVVKDAPPSSPSSTNGRIQVSGTDTYVTYSISGGKIRSIIPDVSANSLIISISSTNNGHITITLPRSLIDAKINNSDDGFFILLDGGEVDFNETTTSRDRILTIRFNAGNEEIEIIGTHVFSEYTSSPTPIPTTPTVQRIPSGANIVVALGSSVPGCESNNSCYQPYKFTVGKGSTVTWFNADSAAHTVTSGTPNGGPSGEFDSSLFMSGATFSHKFDNDGTYPYFCMVHPWMTGYVIIQRGGTVTSPVPTPIPTPSPVPTSSTISVSTDKSQYNPNDLVTVSVSTSTSANVAISVVGPNGDSLVSRSVSTDSRGNGSLQFKLPDSSQNGQYRIDATATISGKKISDVTTFSVKSSVARISIVSLQPTDQQGNTVSSFVKGKLGFVKVILSSDSGVNSLVTINLFDSELTSLGIGSFKTTLGSGQSEMTLSFFIPDDAQTGSADIYANVFSDWPSQGGVPLTGESSTQVRIQ